MRSATPSTTYARTVKTGWPWKVVLGTALSVETMVRSKLAAVSRRGRTSVSGSGSLALAVFVRQAFPNRFVVVAFSDQPPAARAQEPDRIQRAGFELPRKRHVPLAETALWQGVQQALGAAYFSTRFR